jgi:hypothetical protein
MPMDFPSTHTDAGSDANTSSSWDTENSLVQKLAEPFFDGSQSFLPKLSAAGRAAAVRGVAEVFDVNRIVAEIRVSELFPATDQLSL